MMPQVRVARHQFSFQVFSWAPWVDFCKRLWKLVWRWPWSKSIHYVGQPGCVCLFFSGATPRTNAGHLSARSCAKELFQCGSAQAPMFDSKWLGRHFQRQSHKPKITQTFYCQLGSTSRSWAVEVCKVKHPIFQRRRADQSDPCTKAFIFNGAEHLWNKCRNPYVFSLSCSNAGRFRQCNWDSDNERFV